MNLTDMGYYNLVTEVAEPQELYALFEPSAPGEDTGRLEDVEEAIKILNGDLDADNFNTPTSDEWNVQEKLMKGYVLEKIRFNILREEWEPMFNPFPRDPLEYYDPDVTFIKKDYGLSRWYGWVKLRQVPQEHATSADPRTIYVHDNLDDDNRECDFWMDALGIKVEGDDLKDVLDEFHNEAEKQFAPGVAEELGEKLAKFYERAKMEVDKV